MARTVYVTCPFCGAMLEVDTHNGRVVRHFAPREEGGSGDPLADALREVREGTSRREEMFKKARMEEERKIEILEKAFHEKKKEVEESGDTSRPIRDIDL